MNFKDIETTARIKVPGFINEKDEFEVEVKRITPTGLISKGKLNNPLYEKAYNLFFDREVKTETLEDKKATIEYYYAIAEECLVNPTLEEIKEEGLELTDLQLVTLFQFSQGGLRGYESFRNIWRDNEDNNSSK